MAGGLKHDMNITGFYLNHEPDTVFPVLGELLKAAGLTTVREGRIKMGAGVGHWGVKGLPDGQAVEGTASGVKWEPGTPAITLPAAAPSVVSGSVTAGPGRTAPSHGVFKLPRGASQQKTAPGRGAHEPVRRPGRKVTEQGLSAL